MSTNKSAPIDAINIANNELGYLEKKSNKDLEDKTANAGSGNYTKYWQDLCPSFQGQPWCNCFINWVFTKAYGDTQARKLLCTGKDWSYYTPTSAQYFKNNAQWYTSSPKTGDIIFFKNSSRINHVGLVYKVSNNTIFTIEGNTSSGNNTVIANGGGVCAKSYSINNTRIAGYGRPAYTASTTTIEEIPISMDRKGLTVVGATTLNIRNKPGNGKIVGTLKKNDIVNATAKCKYTDGKYWFKIGNNKWISSLYLEGWIKESNNLWWYIQQGYNYPSATVVTIYGEDYAFDKEGWLITKDRINENGQIK